MPRPIKESESDVVLCRAHNHEHARYEYLVCKKCEASICPDCATEAEWVAEACEDCLDIRVSELVRKESELDNLRDQIRFALDRRAA